MFKSLSWKLYFPIGVHSCKKRLSENAVKAGQQSKNDCDGRSTAKNLITTQVNFVLIPRRAEMRDFNFIYS